MTTLPKMTQEDKDGLIALHMAMRTVDRHSADSALVQSLGKFLLEDACTPDDAADILKAVFDEEADRVSSEVDIISASVFDNSSLLCGPRPFGMSKTPDEWLNIRNWGTEWKGKSLFVTPIIAEGEVIGFICYKNDKESAHDMIRLSAQFLAQFAEN